MNEYLDHVIGIGDDLQRGSRRFEARAGEFQLRPKPSAGAVSLS